MPRPSTISRIPKLQQEDQPTLGYIYKLSRLPTELAFLKDHLIWSKSCTLTYRHRRQKLETSYSILEKPPYECCPTQSDLCSLALKTCLSHFCER